MLVTLLLSELWAPMTIGSLVASFLKTLQMHVVLQQRALDIICRQRTLFGSIVEQ